MQNKILICEDEENIVSFPKTELEFEGFFAHVAYDGDDALNKFCISEYCLVLLDIMLPKKNGLSASGKLENQAMYPL